MPNSNDFTDRARKAILVAKEEAVKRGHGLAEPGHLLVALLKVGGVGSEVLRIVSGGLDHVSNAVEISIERGNAEAPRPVTFWTRLLILIGWQSQPMSPQLKHAIEFAIQDAAALGDKYIGTEHMLLGILRLGDSIAAGTLEMLKVDYERVRKQLLLLRATAH